MLTISIWEKRCSVLGNHKIYVNNDIQNPYKMVILLYTECMREMFEIARFLPKPSRKND